MRLTLSEIRKTGFLATKPLSHKQRAKALASLQMLVVSPEHTQSMKSGESADKYCFFLLKATMVVPIYHFYLKILTLLRVTTLSSAPLVCFSSHAAYIANNMDPDTGLQTRVGIGKLFSSFLIQNICCGYSKEPSQ